MLRRKRRRQELCASSLFHSTPSYSVFRLPHLSKRSNIFADSFTSLHQHPPDPISSTSSSSSTSPSSSCSSYETVCDVSVTTSSPSNQESGEKNRQNGNKNNSNSGAICTGSTNAKTGNRSLPPTPTHPPIPTGDVKEQMERAPGKGIEEQRKRAEEGGGGHGGRMRKTERDVDEPGRWRDCFGLKSMNYQLESVKSRQPGIETQALPCGWIGKGIRPESGSPSGSDQRWVSKAPKAATVGAIFASSRTTSATSKQQAAITKDQVIISKELTAISTYPLMPVAGLRESRDFITQRRNMSEKGPEYAMRTIPPIQSSVGAEEGSRGTVEEAGRGNGGWKDLRGEERFHLTKGHHRRLSSFALGNQII